MKFFIALIISFFAASAAGCKEREYFPECAGYGCNYDGKTNLGIKYRDELVEDQLGRTTHLNALSFDYNYKYVSECLGVWYKPHLLIILTNHIEDGIIGRFHIGSPAVILVKPHYDGTDDEILRHEYVHYLLWLSTGSPDGEHVSPLFKQCSDRQY